MRWLLALVLLLWATEARAVACGPVPTSFPLTQTAVSTNFAALYACINGGAIGPIVNPVFTGNAIFDGAVLMRAALTLLGYLYLPSGVYLEAHHGVFWIHTTGAYVPSFGETNLGIETLSKRGVWTQRVLLGPENSGGIGYRMLRVPNYPSPQ